MSSAREAASSAADVPSPDPTPEKFSPEEEAALVAESNATKLAANALFASARYDDALAKYDDAISSCPNYLDYELAVLRSNVAACHLKLEQWKEAIKSATSAIEGLDRLEHDDAKPASTEEGTRQEQAPKEGISEPASTVKDEAEVEAEIVSPGAAKAAPAPSPPPSSSTRPPPSTEMVASQKRKDDILRIRAKALMRRARARSEAGGWQNLAGAEEDYKLLAQMGNLSPADRKIVSSQLRTLPPKVNAAKEKETAEMWGKLKELGNGILKPFGLSTDNFQMVKDEKSGGYSMNFNGGGGGSSSK